MGSQTPFYAFPYPIGTDRVMDGDNAIQALAEKVESVLGKGTSPAARTWAAQRAINGSFGSGVWTGLISMTLTGCPVGAVVLVVSVLQISHSVVGGLMFSRLTSPGATLAPAAQPYVNSGAVNTWQHNVVLAVATVTTAAPTITQEAQTNTGTATVDVGGHMVAVRIV